MAIIGRDGEGSTGYCPEILGTNGQDKTEDERLKNLSQSIVLIQEHCHDCH